MEFAKQRTPEQREKINMPIFSILSLPVRSANRPKGTDMAAAARIYPLITHPMAAAPAWNSLSMEGMDKFNALPVKVVKRAVNTATSNIARLFRSSPRLLVSIVYYMLPIVFFFRCVRFYALDYTTAFFNVTVTISGQLKNRKPKLPFPIPLLTIRFCSPKV